MNYATLAQGYQVLNLILQKKLSTEDLQKLFSTGILALVLEAAKQGKLGEVDQFKLRECLRFEEERMIFHDLVQITEVSYGSPISYELERASLGGRIIEHLLRYQFEDDLGVHNPTIHLVETIYRSTMCTLEHLRETAWRGINLREFAVYFKDQKARWLKDKSLTGKIIIAGSADCSYSDMPKYRSYPWFEFVEGSLKDTGVIRGDDVFIHDQKVYFPITPIVELD